MIIDPENQNNSNNNGLPNSDDYVDSSFMVSFKANESSSVSDKIKESENASDPFEDEFDNFDFDASKSAFKPLDKPVTAEASAPIAEPPKASDKTDFEQVAPVNDPAFTDADLDFKEFTGVKEDPNVNKSLFESGADLDFAGSADSKSPFTTGGDDEFALDEEAMAINPFKPKNADRIPPMPSMPKAGRVPDPALKAQPKAEEPKEAANIKTYGKVSSGVDAFKKPAKEETPASTTAPAAAKPVPSPFKASESKAPAAPAAPAPSPFEKKAAVPAMPASVKKDAPAAKPEEKSPFVMNQAEPAKKPQSNVAKVSANTRPAATEAKPAANEAPAFKPASKPVAKPEEAHTAPRANTNDSAHKPMRQQPIPDEKEAGSRPGTSHSSSDHKKTDIEPVTTVKKSKKKSKREKSSKEPGRGGLFALIGVLASIFVLLWVLDNYQTWFGNNDDTTRATQVTAVATATEVVETDTAETTEAVVTEETQAAVATTETTEATEQTTAETTVETTEETTEATTEATTEQTTTTTTEEETTTTTTRSSSSNTPVSCSYTIRNPRVTSDGFVFDLSVTNNGDTVNMNRLNEFTISFNTSSTITNLTSDYFTFTADGNNSFTATPRSGSLPAGERTDITITGTTENHVQHFYINTYHFDWN